METRKNFREVVIIVVGEDEPLKFAVISCWVTFTLGTKLLMLTPKYVYVRAFEPLPWDDPVIANAGTNTLMYIITSKSPNALKLNQDFDMLAKRIGHLELIGINFGVMQHRISILEEQKEV